MTSASDFSDVKVGDRLWFLDQMVVVSKIHTGDWHPVRAKTRGGWEYAFTVKGQLNYYNGPQVLFWDKVEIIPPPRPKRLVKKTIEVRPYREKAYDIIGVTSNALTIVDASDSLLPWCGPIQPIEIEVEE